MDHQEVHQPLDKGFKHLLQSRRTFFQLLKTFVQADWVKRIQEDQLVRDETSYILQDFKALESDLVYRCRIDGQDVIFYILLELQSSVDHRMPWRLLQYMMEIWRNYLHDSHGVDKSAKGFRLPAIVPIVLYNGKQPWTAVRNFRAYQTEPTIFGESLIDFCYELIDVHRYDETSLKSMKGLLPLIFQLEKAHFYTDYLKKIQAFMDSLKVLDEQDLSGFRAWLVRVVIPKLKDETHQRQLQEIANEIGGGDPMFVSNVTVLIEKEFKSARRKGLKEGLKQGIEKGRHELLKQVIINADKLGQPDDVIVSLTGATMEELLAIRELLRVKDTV